MQCYLLAFKELVKLICSAFHVLFLFVSRRFPKQIVIYYHGLKEADVSQFDRQMAYLAGSFDVITVSEVGKADAVNSRKSIVITFDDGFVSFKNNAIPILSKYGLSAAVFVPVGNLGEGPKWPLATNCPDQNEIVMNEDELVQVEEAGFEVLSHGMSHCPLTDVDGERLNAELIESKQILERILRHRILGISYPNGKCDSQVCEAAKLAGYEFGFCIEPYSVGSSPDNLRIGRFSISGSDSMFKFKVKVLGGYQITRHLETIRKFFT